MKKNVFLCFLTLFLFMSCSKDDKTNDPIEEDSEDIIAGMLLVEGSSDTIILGSNKKGVKLTETPEMGVILDYDFLMDVHETICKDFISLMDNSTLTKSLDCSNDSIPVSNVTFYDAILYANKKSQAEGYDSVYDYASATFDSEGHCTNLSGFAFHPERKGFRLPTEAEWVKAASKDFSVENSYNNTNSNYKPHVVCSNNKDSFGFCDFSGNLMELVNDHFGFFKDTTLTNYAGAMNKNDVDERVVKGGYYGLDTASINLFSRGDVYTVMSTSRAEYVGFRLAFGTIPNVVWLNNNGSASSTTITLLASASEIMSYTKSLNTKLAFRNDASGNLVFVDYSDEGMGAVEIMDTINVYHPDISPDGKRVAFSTSFEGVSKTSAVYVRDLNELGTNLIKLDVESAAIPRWRVLENGDTVITYVTNAGNNKDSSTFGSYSTWNVPFSNGAFGTPEKLFMGAYHGGVSKDEQFAVTGASVFRIKNNDSDSTWYNGEQICNVSLNQDKTKRTLFLDFGGKTGQEYVGKKYTVHEYILIADSTGNLIQSFAAPSGYSFDHTEWATGYGESNIVATLSNINGAHEKITLVNLNDTTSINLVESTELWHPCLWVKKTDPIEISTLDPDSAGIYYNTSGANANVLVFRYKMEFLWQYKDSANVVILGSSRSYHGVNPLFINKPALAVNLGVPSTVIYGNTYLFKKYVLPHYDKLKVVVISLDLDRAYNSGHNENNIFYSGYESYPGYVYDKNHNFWKEEEPIGMYEATYNSPGANNIANKTRPTHGFCSLNGDGWGNPTVLEDSTWMDTKASIYASNFDLLVSLIETCQEKDIYVIGVLFPLSPGFKETGAYGSRGLRRSEAPALIQQIADLSNTYSNFTLMDENKMGDHDYTDEMAANSAHLSALGAEQLTKRLDSLIQKLDLE